MSVDFIVVNWHLTPIPCKFVKTPRFLGMRNWSDDFDPTESDFRFLSASGQSEETGGAYITVSPQGSERERRQQQKVAPAPPPPS